jgi:hypothetical protein
MSTDSAAAAASASESGAATGVVGTTPTPTRTSITIQKTSNAALQSKLTEWRNSLDVIHTLESGSPIRNDALIEFVRDFAPGDVEEEDITQYAGSLFSDDEFFSSLRREIGQCESGKFRNSCLLSVCLPLSLSLSLSLSRYP